MHPRQRSRPTANRLRQGAIQEEIFDVVRGSNTPVSPREIRKEVSDRLDVELSFDTVYSFLALALKDDRWPIERVGYGKYMYSG